MKKSRTESAPDPSLSCSPMPSSLTAPRSHSVALARRISESCRSQSGKFFDESYAMWRFEMSEVGPNWTEFSISLVADFVYPPKLFASEILFSM